MRTQDPKQDNPQDQNQTINTANEQQPSMENPDNKFQSLKTLHGLLVKETKEHREQVESLVKAKEALEIELGKIGARKVSLDIENGLFYVFIETRMVEMDGLVNGLVRKMKEQENEIRVLESEVKDLTMRVETERNGGARQMGHGNEKWRQMINSDSTHPPFEYMSIKAFLTVAD
ncbi:hypothetical protein SADUNF_Sadunf17G0137900 [Salix dunnii]|uniref:Uncharacterized protein n=1 Tax=Salix dunnii TaxID=1413687 RepID=A0A835J8A8_9ROSI|nr:hypothetical protein SADUNF_Sadunf17G0137900 [Salix dunnii]